MHPTRDTARDHLWHFCKALDELERTARPNSMPDRFALRAMIEVVDQSYLTAQALAEGQGFGEQAVQGHFGMVAGKLHVASRMLSLPEDSSVRRCLAAIVRRA